MNRWLVSMALLVTSGLASAQELQVASDPATARFEQALAAQVDEILERRVDAASDRALAVLEARHAERMGETARAVAGQPAPARTGAAPVRLVCFGRGSARGTGSC